MSVSYSNASNARRAFAKLADKSGLLIAQRDDGRFYIQTATLPVPADEPAVVEVPVQAVSLDDAAANGRDAFFDGRNAADCSYPAGDARDAWVAAFVKARDEAYADHEAAAAAAAEEQEAAAAEAEALAQIDPPPPAPDMLLLELSVSKDEADAVARFISTRFRRPVVLSVASGRVLKTVNFDTTPPAKAKEPRTAPAPGAPRAPKADPTVKPIITAPSQQKMQQVFDKIEAARGDTAKLQALNTFKRSATYTKMAGRYLDALLAEASGPAA